MTSGRSTLVRLIISPASIESMHKLTEVSLVRPFKTCRSDSDRQARQLGSQPRCAPSCRSDAEGPRLLVLPLRRGQRYLRASSLSLSLPPESNVDEIDRSATEIRVPHPRHPLLDADDVACLARDAQPVRREPLLWKLNGPGTSHFPLLSSTHSFLCLSAHTPRFSPLLSPSRPLPSPPRTHSSPSRLPPPPPRSSSTPTFSNTPPRSQTPEPSPT